MVSQTKTRWRVLLAAGIPISGPETMANNDGQIPKNLYFLSCTAHFPEHCTLPIQIHVAPTLPNAPPCSTWLDSAPFGSGQLKLGSPLLLHSLEIFPHRRCFSALCVGAASQWNGKGMGNLRGCGSQG